MSFKEKIDKILEVNQLGINSVSAFEDKIGAGRGAVNEFYNEDREPGRKTLKKIMTFPGLNPTWYNTGEGPIFVKNGTYVKTPMENPKNEKVHEEVYRDLVESNSEYRLVPKVILDRYEILSQRELESRERVLSAMLDQAKEISATKQLLLDEKDKLIVALEEEIYELRAKLNQIPPAEGAQ